MRIVLFKLNVMFMQCLSSPFVMYYMLSMNYRNAYFLALYACCTTYSASMFCKRNGKFDFGVIHFFPHNLVKLSMNNGFRINVIK